MQLSRSSRSSHPEMAEMAEMEESAEQHTTHFMEGAVQRAPGWRNTTMNNLDATYEEFPAEYINKWL